MKLEKIFFILSTIIVVVLAGCAKQSSVATAGVVIEKFTPQVSAVASNSPVEFTLTVKNIGEREATDVKAVLGGLIFTKEPEHWKLSNEKILKSLEPADLEGEDAEAGFKGDQGIATWRLTAPTQARDQTYEPTVNLVYNYSTVSTILIKAVDFNYLQSLPENEQETIDTGVIVSKTTKGPILVSVKTDQAVISGSSTLPIEIEFKNIGGGRTFLGGGKETNSSILYTNIKNGLDTILVELPTGIQKCNLNPQPDGKYKVRLIEGKNSRILCNRVIPPTATIQTFSMDIKAEYRYLIEGKTAVKVSKTLYQPPIYDLSITDSKFDISHEHASDKIRVNFIARLTNIGNQPINNEDFKNIEKTQGVKKYSDGIEVFEAHSVGAYITEPRTILSKDKKLESFNSVELEEIWIEQPIPPDEQIVVNVKLSTVPNFDEDINTVNNQLNPDNIPTVLSYEISIETLTAALQKDSSSVKVTTRIANTGKNVLGQNIPVEIKAGGLEIDYPNSNCNEKSDTNIEVTNDYIKIKTLDKGSSQEIVCTYVTKDTPEAVLKSTVSVEVKYDLLEIQSPTTKSTSPSPPDTTPPKLSDGLPTGVWATDSPTLSLKTDESATCRYSTKPNVKYDDMTSAFSKGADDKSHTASSSKLSDGDYTYYVRCADVFGNKNTEDFKISFKVFTN